MARILIVDDAAFMRLSLRLLFQEHGFEVVGEAEDGMTAVRLYQDLKPDLVTMDITMKGMNGIEALKAIRILDPKAKVVMVSSMGQEQLVKEAIIHGAKAFIVKPYMTKRVIESVTWLTATHDKAGGGAQEYVPHV